MILADKIMEERKKLGLSQEELAEKLSVSRQAVSKWESAQSIPDLQRILAMSELFSVSTDYLLKDNAAPENAAAEGEDSDKPVRRISMEEANVFLETMEEQSRTVALGVFLCILCPVLLIFLNGLAEANLGGISEAAACAIGMAALFLLVAVAVFLFIRYGSKTERFSCLQTEIFETAYGVTGMVKQKKDAFASTYTKYLSLGIVLCVLSPLPLIVAACLSEADVVAVSMTALLLCVVAVGVYLIVRVSQVQTSYNILLQEGDYRKSEKKRNRIVDAAGGAYWCIATAIFLAWSFLTRDWKTTWLVWPIAGVLFAPFHTLVSALDKDKRP